MSKARMRQSGTSTSRFRLRVAAFIVVSLAVVAAAFWLVRPGTSTPAPTDSVPYQNVEVTMAGFQPSHLRIAASQSTRLRLINPDSPYHSDGGGVHQFTVPELGIDVKVPPRSTRDVTLPAAPAGTYAFYCDVCCGGKENPSMQGTITVG